MSGSSCLSPARAEPGRRRGLPLPLHRPGFAPETDLQPHKALFVCFLGCSPWIRCLSLLPACRLASPQSRLPSQQKGRRGLPPWGLQYTSPMRGGWPERPARQWLCSPWQKKASQLGQTGERSQLGLQGELERPTQTPPAEHGLFCLSTRKAAPDFPATHPTARR